MLHILFCGIKDREAVLQGRALRRAPSSVSHFPTDSVFSTQKLIGVLVICERHLFGIPKQLLPSEIVTKLRAKSNVT